MTNGKFEGVKIIWLGKSLRCVFDEYEGRWLTLRPKIINKFDCLHGYKLNKNDLLFYLD